MGTYLLEVVVHHFENLLCDHQDGYEQQETNHKAHLNEKKRILHSKYIDIAYLM